MSDHNSRMTQPTRRRILALGLLLGMMVFAAACSDDAASEGGWDLEYGDFEEADVKSISDAIGDLDDLYQDAGPEYVDTIDEIDAGPVRCINVIPGDTLDFGTSTVGVPAYKTVIIENCSPNAALALRDIELIESDNSTFYLNDGVLIDALRTGEQVLRAGEQANFTVVFSPAARVSYRGRVQIKSSHPTQAMIELELIGAGTPNYCPAAVAVGSVQGDTLTDPSDFVQAQPLDTILFDGYSSRDTDGQIVRYEWTLISSPTASSSRLETADGPYSSLYLDASGEYQVQLTVYDDEGTMSCGQQAIVTIVAMSGADIHIQLTWAAANGHPDNDLDLHYLHPNAQRWASNSNGWDCYYGNRVPDWRIPNGSPILDTDDLRGPGPENISHSKLESISYKVGVDYYSDHGNGPAYATVEIRHRGILIFEQRDRYLSHKQFWQVGAIYGGDHSFSPVDVVSQGYP